MAEFEETLRITTDILRKHVDPAKSIRPRDSIQNDLGLDSLGVMELVADSRRLVALDLVEVNPTLDIRNTTAEFATELALSALGKGIL